MRGAANSTIVILMEEVVVVVLMVLVVLVVVGAVVAGVDLRVMTGCRHSGLTGEPGCLLQLM